MRLVPSSNKDIERFNDVNKPENPKSPEGRIALENGKHSHRCKCFLCIKRRPTFRDKMVTK